MLYGQHSHLEPLFKDNIYRIIYCGEVNNVGDWKKDKHSHDFLEFIFVRTGKGQIVINGKTYNVKCGDLVIYNLNDEHREMAYDNVEFKLLFVAVRQIYGKEKTHSVLPKNHPQIIGTDYELWKFEDLFLRTIDEMENKFALQSDISIYLAGTLIYHIKKLLQGEPKRNQSLDDICLSIKETIDANFAHIQNVQTVTRAFYVTKYYLYSNFTKMFGITPLQYLTNKKLEYAAHMLTTTSLRVSDVASMAGYGNELYFSRLFKKHYATSPSNYRLQNQSNDENVTPES